jgi:hypothetical protein
MSHGLSHIVLTASSQSAFDEALAFYCSVGFQIVSDSDDKEDSYTGKIAWLAMFGDKDQKDFTIKLKTNPSLIPKKPLSADVDYNAEKIVMVIATSNLQVS